MSNENGQSSAAVLSLPKGGGAIKGIGETFQANLFTGTGNFTIPIPVSPGRSGFSPALSLQYSTGNGNGLFGLGWELSIPRITRKTEKGLPKYSDEDVFLLSGAEDLVLQFRTGTTTPDTLTRGLFTIHRYRPRTEGLFARIEKWVDASGDAHWRATTKDNVTSVYGRTSQARIVDSTDSRRVYEWLLEETFDAKGNHIYYEYAGDDPALALNKIYEKDRRYNQRYIRRICYGNLNMEVRYTDGTPVGIERQGLDHRDRVSLLRRRYVFEVSFDYGNGGGSQASATGQELFGVSSPPLRDDPFSSFRAGFEVRTLRRCQRVLMLHHFAELGGPTLVRSTSFDYTSDPNTHLSVLASVTVTGHRKTQSGGDVVGEMPPIVFKYSEFQPHKQRFKPLEGRNDDLPGFPLSSADVALVDLFGDGLPDVLHTSAAGFRYWKNLGNGLLDGARFLPTAPAGLTLSQPAVSLADVDGDGRVELLLRDGTVTGYYEATADGGWDRFQHYHDYPTFSFADPNLRMVDLTGDGRPDVLLTGDHHFLWFECLGENGYSKAKPIERLHSLQDFPDVYFNDSSGRLRLADMNGDGLADIVLLHNGRVDYWPNLGYGKFGARITMATVSDAPMLESTFDPRRLFLVDLDGSGCADLVYVEFDRVYFWFNQSGNAWSSRQTIHGTPLTHSATSLEFADVFGTGTATLLWSYNFGLEPGSNYKALDFCGGVKPYVLIEMDNNMGASTRVRYAPSTKFAVEDRQNGEPWVTHLPFPVHVVEKVETIDHVSKTKLVTAYKYHHGYFDGREREFRGFGRVDRFDSELFEIFGQPDLHGPDDSFTNAVKPGHLPPVLTKTWHHTGAYFEDGRELLKRYQTEFYGGDHDKFELAAHVVETGESAYEAHRALRGAVLHTEIYTLDGSPKEPHPFVLTDNRYNVRNLQGPGASPHGIYLTTLRESLVHHYERNPADPRVAHEITLAVDDYGNVTDALSIGYARRQPVIPEQGELKVIYTKQDFINVANRDDAYHVGVACQSRSFEITGIQPINRRTPLAGVDFDPIRNDIQQSFALGSFLHPGDTIPNGPAKRLVGWTRIYFRTDASANDLDTAETGAGRLPLGQIESLALPYESYSAAFNPYLVDIFGREEDGSPRVNTQTLRQAGYRQLNDVQGYWWIPSGRQTFDPALFYQTDETRDPFGAVSQVEFDRYSLLPIKATDALTNEISAVQDYRVLQPSRVADPNGAKSCAAYDALGLVVATALQGHSGEGDLLDDVPIDLSTQQIHDYAQNPLTHGPALLGSATTRIVYDLSAFKRDRTATMVSTLVREQHVHVQRQAPVQYSFLYSDGFGRSVQRKIRGQPGPIPTRDSSGRIIVNNGEISWTDSDTDPRWVATGWTVLNNKGKPVKQYEPFFTDLHTFESDVRVGVSSTVFYDPVGRAVATLHPNRTYEKIVFDPWRQETWDTNDSATLKPHQDSNVGTFFTALPQGDYSPTWYDEHIGSNDPAEKRAAELVASHADTPSIAHLDSLGRTAVVVADTGTRLLETRSEFDILGNDLSITDPRGVRIFEHTYDLAKRKLVMDSRDAGSKRVFADVANKPCLSWDGRKTCIRSEYDSLQRLTGVWVRLSGRPEFLAQRNDYGEATPGAKTTYHRTRVWRVCDGAGQLVSQRYDFKGNLEAVERRLNKSNTGVPDWSGTVPLEAAAYVSYSVFDALNRLIGRTEPDGSSYDSSYNQASLLDKILVSLPGSNQRSPIVTRIDYNARGQRTRIAYGNDVITSYVYDLQTFRLRALKSERIGQILQDLRYTHDPVGNITEIYDTSFEQVFNENQRIEPANRYVYDAVYRLVQASGREHTGLSACLDYRGDKKQTEYVIGSNLQPINNGHALRNYTQSYQHDAAGNLETMQHSAGQGSWTRRQTYESGSNRLLTSDVGCQGEDMAVPHDGNGNITSLPHLKTLSWDHLNHLLQVDLGTVNNGKPDIAQYSYDAAGIRVRKMLVQGQRRYERIYLGTFEIYREYNNGRLDLERSTLHVIDNQERVALIETRSDSGQATDRRVRYQLGNHLGSAMRELDERARTITYEEYYPYGGTAYMIGTSSVEIERKRYRYSGKERDDETGLYYYGARYYAPWMGRWMSCDRLPGLNLFHFCRNNPVVFSDPTGFSETAKTRPKPIIFEDAGGVQASGFQKTMTSVGEGTYKTIIEPLTPGIKGKGEYISTFDMITGEFKGGWISSEEYAEGAASALRSEHITSFLRDNPGKTIPSFNVYVVEEETLKDLAQKKPFEDTLIGKHLKKIFAVEGAELKIDLNSVGIVEEDGGYRITGKLSPMRQVPTTPAPVLAPEIKMSVGAAAQDAAAAKPSGAVGTRALSTAEVISEVAGPWVSRGATVLTWAGRVAGVLGAHNQAAESYATAGERHGDPYMAYVITFAVTGLAHPVDEAMIAFSEGMYAGPVIDSYENYGSGPTQIFAGNLLRKADAWWDKNVKGN